MLDGQQPEEPELDEDQDAADAAAVAASPVVETAPASDILLQNAISAAEALVAEQLLNATAPARTDGEFEVGYSHRLSTLHFFQSDLKNFLTCCSCHRVDFVVGDAVLRLDHLGCVHAALDASAPTSGSLGRV